MRGGEAEPVGAERTGRPVPVEGGEAAAGGGREPAGERAAAGLSEALARLDREEHAAVALPEGGQLYLDRPLPFLVAYRRPPGRCDLAAERLVTGEASYLVGEDGAEPETAAVLDATVERVIRHLGGRFPCVLLAEVWTTPGFAGEAGGPDGGPGAGSRDAAPGGAETSRGPSSQVDGAAGRDAADLVGIFPGEAPPPAFRVVAAERGTTARALASALRRVELDDRPARVELAEGDPAPPDLPPLAAVLEREERSPLVRLGVEVAPVFRGGEEGPLYPRRLAELRRQWHEALDEGLAAFCRERAGLDVAAAPALGRRGVPQALWQIDRALAEVAESFDFLLQLTPVNPVEAWHDFAASGCERAPRFRYRPLTVDVDLFKRRLYEIPLERIEDPALTLLFREKQEELDRQISMLLERETPLFFHGSMLVYGEVGDELVATARDVLDRFPSGEVEAPIEPRPEDGAGEPDGSPRERLDAARFAEIARREVAYYRRLLPELPTVVEVREDLHSGLMVSRGRLLVGAAFTTTRRRAEALVHHEVGTHVLTYLNGRAQRFRQLYLGFAGYESLQEGLAVLAEYLVGGLTAARLRTLAARVLAVRARIDGADFGETFKLLTSGYGFADEAAFTVVLRVYRGGGFTKDAVYLAGLVDLLAYLGAGGDLEPLYVGKIGARHVAIVEELALRGVLEEAPLAPRFLFETEPLARLERVRRGLAVADLIDPPGARGGTRSEP